MNIVLAGPPKAGKSVVSNALYKTLLEKKVKFFLERLHPDCEGMWTSQENDYLARRYKNVIKQAGNFFCEDFVEYKLMSIKNLSKAFDIVLYDLGGIPSVQNYIFINTILDSGLTVGVLLYSSESDRGYVNDWKDFLRQFKSLNLLILQTDWKNVNVFDRAQEYVQDILKFIEFVQSVFVG